MNNLLNRLCQSLHVDALVTFLESKALDQVEWFNEGGIRFYYEECNRNDSDEVEKKVGAYVPIYDHLYPSLWEFGALRIVVSYAILDYHEEEEEFHVQLHLFNFVLSFIRIPLHLVSNHKQVHVEVAGHQTGYQVEEVTYS
jgi:hypothetical protein